MLGFAIGEIIYSTNFYSSQINCLKIVEDIFDADPENINREESVKAVSDALTHWEKGKKFIMIMGNHNTVKFLNEKMVSLNELARLNQQYDANVALKVTLSYLEDLKSEAHPIFSNIF